MNRLREIERVLICQCLGPSSLLPLALTDKTWGQIVTRPESTKHLYVELVCLDSSSTDSTKRLAHALATSPLFRYIRYGVGWYTSQTECKESTLGWWLLTLVATRPEHLCALGFRIINMSIPGSDGMWNPFLRLFQDESQFTRLKTVTVKMDLTDWLNSTHETIFKSMLNVKNLALLFYNSHTGFPLPHSRREIITQQLRFLSQTITRLVITIRDETSSNDYSDILQRIPVLPQLYDAHFGVARPLQHLVLQPSLRQLSLLGLQLDDNRTQLRTIEQLVLTSNITLVHYNRDNPFFGSKSTVLDTLTQLLDGPNQLQVVKLRLHIVDASFRSHPEAGRTDQISQLCLDRLKQLILFISTPYDNHLSLHASRLRNYLSKQFAPEVAAKIKVIVERNASIAAPFPPELVGYAMNSGVVGNYVNLFVNPAPRPRQA